MPRNALSSEAPLPMSAITEQSISSDWNTNRLGARLGVDVASAATAGALTCPVITVIDRYASYKLPLMHPHASKRETEIRKEKLTGSIL